VDLNHSYRGASTYFPDHVSGPHRLIVGVLCQLGDPPVSTHALLDTGSDWCVLPPWLAERLGFDRAPNPAVPPLLTRFGTLWGRQERLMLTFRADIGDDLTVEATCFISENWPGPLVIGWKGMMVPENWTGV
jgi:hypothetical protein